MRSEAERFAHMNPMDLKDQNRWLFELDGKKYIRGDGHYIDKCYFIAKVRAAIRVGNRRVKYRRRNRKSDRSKHSRTDVTQRQQKRVSDDSEVPSVVTVRNIRRKKQVVSVASRMANLKSNKSYLPGD